MPDQSGFIEGKMGSNVAILSTSVSRKSREMGEQQQRTQGQASLTAAVLGFPHNEDAAACICKGLKGAVDADDAERKGDAHVAKAKRGREPVLGRLQMLGG